MNKNKISMTKKEIESHKLLIRQSKMKLTPARTQKSKKKIRTVYLRRNITY